MKLSLHIGTPKSGTTTIQRFLVLNHDLLRENGVYIPQSPGRSNQRRLAAMFMDDDIVDDFFRRLKLQDRAARITAKHQWRADLVAELETQPCPHVLMSSEHLQSRLHDPEGIRALADFLQTWFTDIRIILYIRDPLDTAISLYSTAVKSGSRLSDLPLSPPEIWAKVINHKATIRRWQTNMPAARIEVRLFQKEDFVQGDLLADFIAAAGLPDLDYVRPERANESLNRVGLDLLRRLNKEIPAVLPDGRVNPQRGNIKKAFETHFNGNRPFLPSAEAIDAYDTAFAASNDWVRRTFFPDRTHLFTPKSRTIATEAALAPQDLDQMAALVADLWRQKSKRAGHRKRRK